MDSEPRKPRALPGTPRNRALRRAFIAIVGFGMLTAGLAMLVLPGPGWLTIFAGLAVLALEFTWARQTLAYGKRAASSGGSWLRAQPAWVRTTSATLAVALLVIALLLVLARCSGQVW